jgi:4-aminobutyrate aminotransferase-like enzyme
MARTGRPWAFTHFDVVPDILCMGKALGGGMAIGGLATSTSLLGLFAHGPSLGHITTFGGHPMACAGAIGALEAMSGLDFDEVEARNRAWHVALERHPAVRHVRRLGAFIAVELDNADAVHKAVHAGLDRREGRGVLLFWFLSVPHAFRLAPPLTCTDAEMDLGLELILKALDQAV